MEFDFSVLPARDRYKILASSVTPRPIAWVTSCSAAGVPNAAPYSFFNLMGDDPPTLALGLLKKEGGERKDTARNIVDTGEFVVNLVSAAQAGAMNLTSMDAPPDIDELACAGLATLPSTAVAPPRIAGAPVSFECRALHVIETGPAQLIIIGQVCVAHIEDEYLLDAERLHIDAPAMALVARMHGKGWYARPTELFHMERPTYAAWLGRDGTPARRTEG